MSILAAKCPCCGRDIGIQENTEEYSCVFCGAKLKVSALKTELIEKREAVKEEPKPEKHAGESRASHGEKEHAGHGADAPELSQEEIDRQLKRKAEFKEELHSAVRQIDELRQRRPKLEAKLRTINTLGIIGAILAVAAGAAIVLFAEGSAEEGSGNTMALIVAGGIALVSLFMLILSFIRRSDIKKQRKRLEDSIIEKKQKRDILIGRLNKINKMLHIHSDEHHE